MGECSMGSAYSMSKRSYVMAFVAVGLQILLAGFALCSLIELKYYGQDLEYTWPGVLLPVVLFLAHCTTFYFLCRSSKQVHPRLAGLVLSSLLPMVCVGLWLLLFAAADQLGWAGGRRGNVYYWFFLQSGRLPPGKLVGLSLTAAFLLLSLAASLGLVPLGVALRIVGRVRNHRGLRIAGVVALLIPAAIVLAIVLWIVLLALSVF